MSDGRFQLLAADVRTGVGIVRTPIDELLVLYPPYSQTYPISELGMEILSTHLSPPDAHNKVGKQQPLFDSLMDVVIEMKRIGPRQLITQPLIQWDAKKSPVRLATRQQLYQLLNRAIHEFIPEQKYISALRVAEGIQYARKANLAIYVMADSIAKIIYAAKTSTPDNKRVAGDILARWRRKLSQLLENIPSHTAQELDEFLGVVEEEDLRIVILQIEQFLRTDPGIVFLMEHFAYISSFLRNVSGVTRSPALVDEVRAVLKNLNEAYRVKIFCEQPHGKNPLFIQNRYGLDLNLSRKYEPRSQFDENDGILLL